MTEHSITLTHLNIRQSIAILLTKLIVSDVLFAFLVIGGYALMVQGETIFSYISHNTVAFLLLFVVLGISKTAVNIKVVLQWLFEYYEITPSHIDHHKGILVRTSEQYQLPTIRRVAIKDSFLGEVFNFATLKFYDIRLNPIMDMYLIHNPDRYIAILKNLLPNLEVQSDRVFMPFVAKLHEHA